MVIEHIKGIVVYADAVINAFSPSPLQVTPTNLSKCEISLFAYTTWIYARVCGLCCPYVFTGGCCERSVHRWIAHSKCAKCAALRL